MHLEDIGLMFIVLCEKQQRVCRKVWHLVESIAIFTICMKAFLYQGTLSEGFNIKGLLSHKKNSSRTMEQCNTSGLQNGRHQAHLLPLWYQYSSSEEQPFGCWPFIRSAPNHKAHGLSQTISF